MSGFQIDRTELDEAGRICRALVVISLLGAVICIGAYFIGS